MLGRIRADAPRKVWTPSDFVDLASRDAVDKTLQRLTKQPQTDRSRPLRQPGFNKLTQKPNPPDPRSVIDAVGRRDQTRMLVDGMTAANDLGLTDAVPAKIVVHTDARRRAIKLGNVTITFRPTAASKLFWAGRPAMRVVQAEDDNLVPEGAFGIDRPHSRHGQVKRRQIIVDIGFNRHFAVRVERGFRARIRF